MFANKASCNLDQGKIPLLFVPQNDLACWLRIKLHVTKYGIFRSAPSRYEVRCYPTAAFIYELMRYLKQLVPN